MLFLQEMLFVSFPVNKRIAAGLIQGKIFFLKIEIDGMCTKKNNVINRIACE